MIRKIYSLFVAAINVSVCPAHNVSTEQQVFLKEKTTALNL